MKVVERTRADENLKRYDYRDRYQLELETADGRRTLEFGDGEPEDSNLSRDFSDVYSISTLLQMAFDAGARGEAITFENEDLSE
jgi:hypothetical protein